MTMTKTPTRSINVGCDNENFSFPKECCLQPLYNGLLSVDRCPLSKKERHDRKDQHIPTSRVGHPLCPHRSHRLGMGLPSYQARLHRVWHHPSHDRQQDALCRHTLCPVGFHPAPHSRGHQAQLPCVEACQLGIHATLRPAQHHPPLQLLLHRPVT